MFSGISKNVGYSQMLSCMVTQRPDVESTHQDNHFDIYVMVQPREMLLIWTTSLDSKKQDPCGIVDRTYLLKC